MGPTVEIWRQPRKGDPVANLAPREPVHIGAHARERVVVAEGGLAAEMDGVEDAAERVEVGRCRHLLVEGVFRGWKTEQVRDVRQ